MRWVYIGLKDLTMTLRDRAATGILIAMPMLLIVILGSALGDLAANISKIPVAIVNLDEGSVGADITDGYFTEEALTKLFDAKRMRDPAAARSEVERGDLAGALVVPADFTRRLNTGKPSELTIYSDPGRQITGSVFRAVAEAISTRVSAASIAARTSAYYVARLPVSDPGFVGSVIGKAVQSASGTATLEAVALEETTAARGKEIPMLAYYAGGMSAMFIMFGAMFGAFSLVRERDHWTLPRMLMSPASRLDIVAGKMLGVFIVGLVQFGVLFVFTSVLGVQWGDPVAIWAIAVSMVAAATGMSILIAAVGKTTRSVSGIAQIVIQFMAAVGGSFFPVTQFPEWLQPLHYASVNGWAIDGILETMRGGSVVAVVPNVAALLGMAVLFFAIGAWRLRWE
ncbi:MAG TPA: ABC transporter permease [Coriobacteriia bacterium]